MFRSPVGSPPAHDDLNFSGRFHTRIDAFELDKLEGYYFWDRKEQIYSLDGVCLLLKNGKQVIINSNIPAERHRPHVCNHTPNTFSATITLRGEVVQRGINVIFNQANPFYHGDEPLKKYTYIKLGSDERAQHIWYPLSDPRSTPDGSA